jgi:hypothetical protein
MRIAFQSKPEDKARFFVRISEFSFAAYPVQIRKVFRATPAAPISEISSRHSRRREIGAGILRRVASCACRHFTNLDNQTNNNY